MIFSFKRFFPLYIPTCTFSIEVFHYIYIEIFHTENVSELDRVLHVLLAEIKKQNLLHMICMLFDL